MNIVFVDINRAGYPQEHVQCTGTDGCGALALGSCRHIHLAWHEKQERQFTRVWDAIKDLGGAK